MLINVYKNNYILLKKKLVNPLNTSDPTFKLINEVKRNDYVSAQNSINMYKNIINNIDSRGWTALHWACYFGYESIVKLLINNEAKLDIKTLKGFVDGKIEFNDIYAKKTAKEIAEMRHHKTCVKMITNCRFKRGFMKTVDVGKTIITAIPK